MDKKDLKIQAYKESLRENTERSEEKIADLRVEITILQAAYDELNQRYQESQAPDQTEAADDTID